MKLFFLFMLMSLKAFSADCYLFQLKGLVEENKGFTIKIHEGTNSEKKFIFPQEFDLRMAVYHNKNIQGKFILKDKEPVSGSEIVGIESTELAVPDPLYHHKEITFQKSVPCPVKVKGKP